MLEAIQPNTVPSGATEASDSHGTWVDANGSVHS